MGPLAYWGRYVLMLQQNLYHHSFAPKTDIFEIIIAIVFETMSELRFTISSKTLEYSSFKG